MEIVLDHAEQKGTGRWTVQETVLDLGVPVSGIAEAVFARSLSGHADLPRAAARGLPGPSRGRSGAADLTDKIEQALYASKLVSYAQGWNMMAAGSQEYDWDIDLGQVAVIWRGGCIIRAAFLDRIRAAYENNPELPTLLTDEDFSKDLADAQDAWRPGRHRGPPRHPRPRLLRRPGLLRRATGRTPARRPGPGPARLLRRAHLPPHGPRRHVPYAVGPGPFGGSR